MQAESEPTPLRRKEENYVNQRADNVAVAQLLGTEAILYTEKVITATIGKPQPGSSALEALDRARRILFPKNGMPRGVIEHPGLLMEAWQHLQMTAVMFTAQLAASNSHSDPTTLRLLKDKLVAMLKHQGAARVLLVHDDAAVAQNLGDRALDYARQIILAEDSGAPIGSAAVERAVTDLQTAAVAFTAQLAISEGHDPKVMRQIEAKVVEMLTHRGAF
jgi:hypothetical protein